METTAALAFRSDDEPIVTALREVVEIALRRFGLGGLGIARLGCLKWLMDELPAFHPEYFGAMTLSADYETGVAMWTIKVSDEGLCVRVGEILRDSYGSDYSSTEIFKVGDEEGNYFKCDDWEDWVAVIRRNAADPDISLQVEWFPEDVLPAGGGPREDHD